MLKPMERPMVDRSSVNNNGDTKFKKKKLVVASTYSIVRVKPKYNPSPNLQIRPSYSEKNIFYLK